MIDLHARVSFVLIGWHVHRKSERESVPIVRGAPRGGDLVFSQTRSKISDFTQNWKIINTKMSDLQDIEFEINIEENLDEIIEKIQLEISPNRDEDFQLTEETENTVY